MCLIVKYFLIQYSFIYSFNNYLLSTYYALVAIINSGDNNSSSNSSSNKTEFFPEKGYADIKQIIT